MRITREPIRRFVWFLVVASLVAGCGVWGTQAEQSYTAGRKAFKQNALREALQHFRTAAIQAPASAAAHSWRGMVAESLGEFDEALEAYRAAVKVEPSFASNSQLGALADRMGETDLAVESLRASLSVSWVGRARQSLRASLSDFLDCVAGSSALSRSAWWGGCAAISVTVNLRTFWRGSEEVAQYLFRVLIESGDHEGALELARGRGWVRAGADYCGESGVQLSDETAALLAMLVHPERADCLLPIAMALTDGGLVRLAHLVLMDQIRNSRDPRVREKAEAFLRHRLPAHTVVKLGESLNIVAYRLQHRHKKPAEALEAYQKAIAADPSFSWPYSNIGTLYLNRGENERALDWLRKAVAVNPNHYRALVNLGISADRLNRYDEAIAAYRRAIALEPDGGGGHANLGWILLRLGREAEAIRELRTAVRLDPTLKRERAYLNQRFGADPRGGPTALSAR